MNMILYKYLSYSSAVRLLTSNTLSFSSYQNFNDPYELCCVSHGDNNVKNIIKMHDQISFWGQYSAILCLTRQPLNPLMWAHYADSHKGIVVGFDVTDPSFTSLDENILPVQFGNVIYAKTQPISPFFTNHFPVTSIENFIGFNTDYLERLQRTFLYKSYHWSYEEEVRIVKHINCQHLTKIPNIDVFTMDITQETVKEIYIGLRMQHHNEFMSLCNKHHPQAKIKKCVINGLSWDMHCIDFNE